MRKRKRKPKKDYNLGMAKPDDDDIATIAKLVGKSPEIVASWFVKDDQPTLTIEDVMRILKVSKSTAIKLMNTGEIRGRKAGRAWRTSEAELAKWLIGYEVTDD